MNMVAPLVVFEKKKNAQIPQLSKTYKKYQKVWFWFDFLMISIILMFFVGLWWPRRLKRSSEGPRKLPRRSSVVLGSPRYHFVDKIVKTLKNHFLKEFIYFMCFFYVFCIFMFFYIFSICVCDVWYIYVFGALFMTIKCFLEFWSS